MTEKQNAEMLAIAEEIEINWRIGADQKFSNAEARVIQTALRLSAAPSPHPRGEPVAWQIEINGIWQNLPGDWSESENNPNHVYRPLFAAPPPAGADAVRWQPIETAPKDGTWILTISLPYASVPTSLRWLDARWWDDAEDLADIDAEWQPSHWMPIPPAPQPQEKPTGDQT